jgi:uncharacterized protein (DUF2062 family)
MTISGTLRKLLNESTSPTRSAVSFATGVAISFSPFLGLHILIAILAAFLLRLNKVEVILGTLVNNPWTVPFVYSSAFLLGNHLLGRPVPPFNLETVFSSAIFWPLMLGCAVYMAVVGLLSFVLLRAYLVRRQKARETA